MIKSHEVRVGMAVYWVSTRPEANGYAYECAARGVAGWSAGTRREALFQAKESLAEKCREDAQKHRAQRDK